MLNKLVTTYLQNIHKQTHEDIVFIMEDDIFSSCKDINSLNDLQSQSDFKILNKENYLLGMTCKNHSSDILDLICCGIDTFLENSQTQTSLDHLLKGILTRELTLSSLSSYPKASSLQPPFQVFIIQSIPLENQKEVLETLLPFQTGNDCIFLFENDLVIFKEDCKEDFASEILDFCNGELLLNVDVSYSSKFFSMDHFEEAYLSAKQAYQICKTFSYSKHLFTLEDALLERIIYALDKEDVNKFKQGFHFEEIDEEEKTTFDMYVRCNLNLSLTSRNLYIHRNTLIYRLDKLSKKTGIDVQTFQGALTLQLYLYLFARSDA